MKKLDERAPTGAGMQRRASGLYAPASAMTSTEMLMNSLHTVVQKCCAELGIKTVEELGRLTRAAPPRGFIYPVYMHGTFVMTIVGEPVE